MDLRTKLVLTLVAASLLSMLALGGMAYAMADELLTDRAARQLASLAVAKAEDLENVVEGWEDRVSLIASRHQLRLNLGEFNRTRGVQAESRILQVLVEARRASGTISVIAVYDREGQPVTWTGLEPGDRPLPLDPSELPRTPDTVVYDGVSFLNGGPPVAHFVAPVTLDGRWQGTLRVSLGTRDLRELAGNRTGLGRTGETLIAIRDTGGRVRVLTPVRDTAAANGAAAHYAEADDPVEKALRGEEGPFTEGITDYRGEPVWADTRLLPELGWAVVVKFDESEEREAVVQFREQLTRVGFSLSAFAILLGTLLGLRFAKPIHDLAEVANRVRMGELEARVDLNREDELGLLALTFNEMAEELEDQMGLLREYEKFFDLSPEMLCIAGADRRFRRVNPAFERTLGWSAEELTSRSFVEFVHPDDVEKTLRETERLAQGIPTVSFENRYRCPDGSYKRIRWTCHPDEESGLLYAVARHVPERE